MSTVHSLQIGLRIPVLHPCISHIGSLKHVANITTIRSRRYKTHQSLPYKMLISAMVRLIPSPPARVVNRKKVLFASRLVIIINRDNSFVVCRASINTEILCECPTQAWSENHHMKGKWDLLNVRKRQCLLGIKYAAHLRDENTRTKIICPIEKC